MIEITLQQAIQKLQEELTNDKLYYYSWQSNIAMSIIDETKLFQDKHGDINPSDLHELANDAAKRFLELLISQQ